MTDELVLDTFEDIRVAFSHPDLSRGVDRRSYEEGNPRAGILSVLHGDAHRRRRRLENRLFRRDALVEYERVLFPAVLERILDERARGGVDLFELVGRLSVILAARRAGIDHDGSAEQLAELWRDVLALAQAAAILDVLTDGDTVQARAREVLTELDERYVTPSLRRREALLDAAERDPDLEVPYDLLTVALAHVADDDTVDHGVLVREAGLYLHGGSHTSAQTTCNTLSFLLGSGGEPARPDLLARVAADIGFAQRCVHETLRLRPTTPRIKRSVVRDAVVAGQDVLAGGRVVLDIAAANRDPAQFGQAPDRFDPDRATADEVPLWGLSFGAGPHICIGRSVAGGFPLQGTPGDDPDAAHLNGLVAQMVHAVVARGVEVDPGEPPEIDRRTDRGTRWSRFPVRFPAASRTAAGAAPEGAGRG